MVEELDWLRALGANEACLWHADHASRINFVTVVHVRGGLGQSALQRALDEVQIRHPLCRVAVAKRRGWPWFVRSSQPVGLRVVDREGVRWETVAEEEANTPIDTCMGPCVRCVWVRGEKGEHTLMLTFHHAIGDGVSGAYVVRDLLKALACVGGSTEALALRPSFGRTFPSAWRGLRRWVGYLVGVGSMLGWLARNGLVRGVKRDMAQVRAKDRRVLCTGRGLSFEDTEALVSRCREEGTTVHGALGAALLSVVAEDRGESGSTPLLLASPVNLRGRLEPPALDDVGFLVSMGVSMHSVEVGGVGELWELAREVRGELMRFVDAGRPWTVLPVQNALMAPWIRVLSPERFAQVVYTTQLDGVGLTNIGRAKLEERYGDVEVCGLSFVASLGPLGDFASTVATCHGRLAWNFMGMQPVVGRERLERLADRSVERVLQMCGV